MKLLSAVEVSGVYRSQKAYVNWEEMDRVLKEYPLAHPHIRYSYQKLQELVVL